MASYSGMKNKLENLLQIPRDNRTTEEKGEIRRLHVSVAAWREHPPIPPGSREYREMMYRIETSRTAEV